MNKIYYFLAAGLVCLLIPMLLMGRWKQIKWYKTILIALIGTVIGVAGTYLWFWVEKGRFGGYSFFGSVFAVPLAFALIFWMFREKYGDIMDLCASAECSMHAVMRIHCYISGCCGGRELFVTESGKSVVFPSQFVELANGLVILAILMVWARRKRFAGVLYPCFMVMYGVTRFLLNFLRSHGSETILGMPEGNAWSLLSIIIGAVWLLIVWKKNPKLFSKQKTT